MTQETKKKMDHWWESYGALIKGLGKFSGRIVIGVITGSFAAGQIYSDFRTEWKLREAADVRHDSIGRVSMMRLDTIERAYVMRDELKSTAFKPEVQADRTRSTY